MEEGEKGFENQCGEKRIAKKKQPLSPFSLAGNWRVTSIGGLWQ